MPTGFYLASLAANALENGTLTLLLVKDFTGALNNDLDTNNDGIFDVTPWDAIVDAVAVNDGGAGDMTYGVPVLGVTYDGLALCPRRRFAHPGWLRHRCCHRLGAQRLRPGRHPRLSRHDRPGRSLQHPRRAQPPSTFPRPKPAATPSRPIYAVQGSGAASPLVGTEVAVEGIVVGDFQNNASAG